MIQLLPERKLPCPPGGETKGNFIQTLTLARNLQNFPVRLTLAAFIQADTGYPVKHSDCLLPFCNKWVTFLLD
jgi:hypothetical protein